MLPRIANSLLIGCLLLTSRAYGQPAAPSDSGEMPSSPSVLPASIQPVPVPDPFHEERIFGVIPDYQTVTETPGKPPAAPLTLKQKWNLALKETLDPFNLANAAIGAGFSQMGNQTPKYGEGMPAYGQRFGAALADFATQNFMSAGLLASVLHQDPRYFRKGPESTIPKRVVYSLSRLVIARQDSGKASFNASGILGMSLGIAASNLYYPSASIRGRVMGARVETSLFGGVTGNLMSEFWPDCSASSSTKSTTPSALTDVAQTLLSAASRLISTLFPCVLTRRQTPDHPAHLVGTRPGERFLRRSLGSRTGTAGRAACRTRFRGYRRRWHFHQIFVNSAPHLGRVRRDHNAPFQNQTIFDLFTHLVWESGANHFGDHVYALIYLE